MKQLPEDIQETTISIVFNGKKRGLNELVGRQRKAGQWVDNTGIMVLTTAHYLARYIYLLELQIMVREDFTFAEKAPTRGFSWLKVPTSAFPFKTVC